MTGFCECIPTVTGMFMCALTIGECIMGWVCWRHCSHWASCIFFRDSCHEFLALAFWQHASMVVRSCHENSSSRWVKTHIGRCACESDSAVASPFQAWRATCATVRHWTRSVVTPTARSLKASATAGLVPLVWSVRTAWPISSSWMALVAKVSDHNIHVAAAWWGYLASVVGMSVCTRVLV